MLELTDVHVRYGNIRALQGVSFRVEQGAGRGLEEAQDVRGLERGGVRHVDDDVGAGEARVHALARGGVETAARRGRDHLVSAALELRDHL